MADRVKVGNTVLIDSNFKGYANSITAKEYYIQTGTVYAKTEFPSVTGFQQGYILAGLSGNPPSIGTAVPYTNAPTNIFKFSFASEAVSTLPTTILPTIFGAQSATITNRYLASGIAFMGTRSPSPTSAASFAYKFFFTSEASSSASIPTLVTDETQSGWQPGGGDPSVNYPIEWQEGARAAWSGPGGAGSATQGGFVKGNTTIMRFLDPTPGLLASSDWIAGTPNFPASIGVPFSTPVHSVTHGYDVAGQDSSGNAISAYNKFPFSTSTPLASLGNLDYNTLMAGGGESDSTGYVWCGHIEPFGLPNPERENDRMQKFPFASDTTATNIAGPTATNRIQSVILSTETGLYRAAASYWTASPFISPSAPTYNYTPPVANDLDFYTFASDATVTKVNNTFLPSPRRAANKFIY